MRSKFLKVLISSVALTTLASAQVAADTTKALPDSTQAAPAPTVADTASVAVADSANVAATDSAAVTAIADSAAVVAVADSANVAATDSAAVTAIADSTVTAAADSTTVADSVAVTTEETSAAAPADSIVYTKIAGALSGFLTAANSPYLTTGDLVVSEKDALVIDAGVEIVFAPGTGLDIQGGAFAAVGQEDSPILFKAESGKWKGISLTGETRASFNNIQIVDAENAIAMTNTGADVRNAKIVNANIGIALTKSSIDLQNSSIKQSTGIAFLAGEGSTVSMGNTELSENKAGYVVEKNTKNTLSNVSITKNDYGMVNMGGNSFDINNLRIQENDIGIASSEVPSQAMAESTTNNRVNSAAGASDIAKALPSAPENAYAQKFQKNDAPAAANVLEEQPKKWNLSGNVSTEVGYHLVRTLHNSTGSDLILGNDTIPAGSRYENNFQVPGFFSGYNTYMKLESPDGRTMEFSAEIGSDHWNEWNVHKVNLTYTDQLRKISLGDTYLNGGSLYLNGINLFGLSYTVDHLKEPGERPTFETSVFAGETKRPKLVGEKNPDIYKDYVEDGEGEPQEVVMGGSITWNMHRRFNGTLGFIASENYKEDPYLRDGMSSRSNTINPEIAASTFFAEGNWLFWPGNIELNAQIAVGSVDTTDVQTQRAINSVFSNAGVSASNYALLRKLVNNENLIASLTRKELEDIFGDNTNMTLSEMRTQLRSLIKQAKKVKNEFLKTDDDPTNMWEWDGDNAALMTSMRWAFGNTSINAYFKLVGNEFYSAGSPDQLSNSRELGASLDQKIMKFWKMNLSYDLNVENASIGSAPNLFGLGEGTVAGLFADPDDEWEKKHGQDDIRSLNIHNAAFKNNFTFGNFDLALKYKMNYRTHHRPTKLRAEYDPESGVFADDWFKPTSGSKTYELVSDNDTIVVDSAKFIQYYNLSGYDYLASGFEEKFLKHTVEAEVGFKFYRNLLKVGGMWIFRSDLSEFENDSLLKGFDFSDRTYGYLGYYFHSADYFEQRYPVSLTTDIDWFRNQIAFTPRYKIYDRDNMKEFEWTLSEIMEVEVVKDFIDVSLNGEFRQEFVRRHSDGANEEEADINTSATVRVHHTKDLYSDYTFGNNYSYRPDSRSEQYNDFFCVFSLNYAF